MAARLAVSSIFLWHLLAILTLGVLNLIVLAGIAGGHYRLMGFTPLFRLSGEGNIPSLFSAVAIAAVALVAARIAQAGSLEEKERRSWRVFAWLFGFMALDEAAQFHEVLGPLGEALVTGGPFYHVAIFPYAVVAFCLAVLLFRFWVQQSPAVRAGIAFAGPLYLLAAVGMETVENLFYSAGFTYDARVHGLIMVEELGEMLAVALFLRTFLVRFEELDGGPLLALVGERPLLAVEVVPPQSASMRTSP